MSAQPVTAAVPPHVPTQEARGATDLIVLGITGDLAMRKLLPALAAAESRQLLPAGLRLVGVGRQDFSTDRLRLLTQEAIVRHAPDTSPWAVAQLTRRIEYHAGDLDDHNCWDDLARVLTSGTGRARVFYLACGSDRFGAVSRHLDRVGLVDASSRVVLEKPLGSDLASSRRISDDVAKVFSEEQTFRIDHYLGKETVQNLLVLRFGNAIFEPLWNASTVDHVQITVAETLSVGARGGYYDKSGAMRDMVQNHLLQLLCLIAMEPPARLDADSIRDAKVAVLRSLRPWASDRIRRSTVRGQYEGYAEESGQPGSTTETFAAIRADIDNWRWAGVPFYLRTGKALRDARSEIVVQFKDVPHWMFPAAPRPSPTRLIIGLQPNEVVHLEMRAKVPGPGPVRLATTALRLDLASAFPVTTTSAYERLLLDVLQGNPAMFMRRDEVEAAWAWTDPVVTAWRSDAVPLHSYERGTHGPEEAEHLIRRDGRSWHSASELSPHGIAEQSV